MMDDMGLTFEAFVPFAPFDPEAVEFCWPAALVEFVPLFAPAIAVGTTPVMKR